MCECRFASCLKTERDAIKFSTTKRSQVRLHGLITAIEVPGQSSIDVIDVDMFAGLQDNGLSFAHLHMADRFVVCLMGIIGSTCIGHLDTPCHHLI